MANTPATRSKLALQFPQQIPINGIQHGLPDVELAGERGATARHVGHVEERQRVGVLLRWRVPLDVVQVVVHCRVPKLLTIAEDCVEVALGGGDEIRVVHEEGAWEVLPADVAIFHE